MEFETVVTIAAGGGLAWGLSYAVQSLYDRIAERYWQLRAYQQSHRRTEIAMELEKVRVLRPDERGRSGIAYDGHVYRDLDSRAVFTQELNLFFDPMMERLNAIHKALLAQSGGGRSATKALEIGEMAAQSLPWPSRVSLEDLFTDRQPSLNDLVIGARPSESGLDVMTLSLHDLMHTLTVGASGWGKSTWLRSFLWQVARAHEPVEVVAIDINGSEFNLLRKWHKLRWPVARETADAVAVLHQVEEELDRRKALYEQVPLASKLTEYNAATGAGLPPWIVVVDEGTNLLNQSGIGTPLRTTVQTARQYGIYIVLAGVSAKHSVVDTQIRDQFSSRLCFRTSPTSSRVVLDDKAASEITVKGRFVAQLVGQEQVELQGPFVSRQAFLEALTGGGPAQTMPTIDQAEQVATETGATAGEVEQIRELWAKGESRSAIARAVYGSSGGDAFYKVKDVLDTWE